MTFYEKHEYSIKPNGNIIEIPDNNIIQDKSELTEIDENHELVETDTKIENESHENILIKLAKTLNPIHGDKLYPLEVLGVYKIIHSDLVWDFYEYGNPESFIDSKITEFLCSCDRQKFKNRLEREISENSITRKIFLLRLNYAYLLEPGKDIIEIKRNTQGNLLFQDMLDAEGNYIGKLESSKLSNEEIEELADKFYKNSQIIQEKNTGTPHNLRDKIKFLLYNSDMEIIENLDEVYHALNKINKKYIEHGLIARVAYLAFMSEINNQNLIGSKLNLNEEIIPPNQWMR